MRLGGGQAVNGALAILIAVVAATAAFGEHGVTHLWRLRAERKALGVGRTEVINGKTNTFQA